MASLKHLAGLCGVSIATVSKALNGHSDIGEETRRHICKIAEELGYFPNAAARALKTGKTYNLGVLFIDQMGIGLAHEYFSLILDSFKTTAESSGYDVMFITNKVGRQQMSYYEHCKYRNCDGVVIISADFSDPMIRDLVESEVPAVTIDHIFNGRTAILSDNVNSLKQLVRFIYGRGHRKVAFIHGEHTSVTQNRLIGFYQACEDFGITVPEVYVKESRYHDPDGSAKAAKELLSLSDPPTCIIFPDDVSFVGGKTAIEEMGLRIPDDVSAAGYDGISLSQVMHPPLTTIRQDTKKLGSEAALRLIESIERPKTAMSQFVLVSGRLIEGGTIKTLSV